MHKRFALIFASFVIICFLEQRVVFSSRADDTINMGRCRAHCLATLQQITHKHLPPVTPLSGSPMSLVQCLEDANCTACIKPCNQPFVNTESCKKICEHESSPSCGLSCRFMKSVYEASPRCPSVLVSTNDDGNCPNMSGVCDNDSQCPDENSLCCPDTCGRFSCSTSKVGLEDFPPLAEAPTVHEKARGTAIELRWSHVLNNNSQPIIYIIDQRNAIGKHYNEGEFSDWQFVVQTTYSSVKIRDVFPGYWYEYRVTTVNMHGSRGAGPVSKPFKLKRDPEPPGAPENVTEGDIEVNGHEISVTVHWLPPSHSDLPITRYKIFWSKRLKSPAALLTSPRENRRLIPGEQLKYTIPELDHDSSYLVQVQAICQYGDMRLKSEKSSLYLDTFTLPVSDAKVRPTSFLIHRPRPTPPALQSLTVQTPYFENGIIKSNISWGDISNIKKVLISWSPEVCISGGSLEDTMSRTLFGSTESANSFVIYDLHFDCRYLVRVQPVSSTGLTGPVSHISFPTPSCHEISVRGASNPDCPSNAAKVLDEPANFRHTFLISNANITARISWEAPAGAHAPITGYRLTWGKAIDSHIIVMDKTTALTKVLNRNDHTHILRGLHEDTTYVVHIQALAGTWPGRIASMEFTTPILQLPATPLGPPYAHFQSATRSTTTTDKSSPELQQIDSQRPSRDKQVSSVQRQQYYHTSSSSKLLPTSHVTLFCLPLLIVCLLKRSSLF